eukprot:6175074-Pleurochrysis_carterae.AAC.6
MAQPAGTTAGDIFHPPTIPGWAGQRRVAHLAPRFWGLHRVHPPDRIGGPTARVVRCTAATNGDVRRRTRAGDPSGPGREVAEGPLASAPSAQSRKRGVRVSPRGHRATPSGGRG